MKKAFHRWGLHEPIAHLNAAIQPTLTIMDASNFLKAKIILSGNSTLEIDSLVVKLLGIPEPDYLKVARNLSTVMEDFEVLGEKPETIEVIRIPKFCKYRNFFRSRLWSNHRACSMGRLVLQDIFRMNMNTPGLSLYSMCKLLKLAFSGVEIVYGVDPEFVQKAQKVICIGDCTKKIARINGYTHVPGCPPDKKAIIDKL